MTQRATQPKPAGEPWTPAQIARELKAALYVIAGAACYGLYCLGNTAEAPEADALELDAEQPAGEPAGGDYEPWEPEP